GDRRDGDRTVDPPSAGPRSLRPGCRGGARRSRGTDRVRPAALDEPYAWDGERGPRCRRRLQDHLRSILDRVQPAARRDCHRSHGTYRAIWAALTLVLEETPSGARDRRHLTPYGRGARFGQLSRVCRIQTDSICGAHSPTREEG